MYVWKDYVKFCELEEEQIQILKWTESERAKRDVGRYYVEWVWVTTERDKWIRGLQASGVLPTYSTNR